MTEPVLVLLHSPLVGPLTWRSTATELSDLGYRVVVPDITRAFAGEPPYQPAIADLVVASLTDFDRDAAVVLVGHSNAGPLLPRIARALSRHIAALLYVDALLPNPGEPWLAHAPQPLVDHLTSLVCDGLLPPWHEWFPPVVIDEILPNPQLRAAFVDEIPRLPYAYFQEPMSPDDWPGQAGYLLLSDGYQEQAAAARQAGMPVVEHVEHHLAMLTAPVTVAAALDRLVSVTLRAGVDGQ